MGIRAEAIWVSWSGLIVRVRVRNRFRLSVTAAIDSARGTVTVGVRDNVKKLLQCRRANEEKSVRNGAVCNDQWQQRAVDTSSERQRRNEN